jgi:hypothetical protein
MRQLHCPAQEEKRIAWEKSPEGEAFKQRMKTFWENYKRP